MAAPDAVAQVVGLGAVSVRSRSRRTMRTRTLLLTRLDARRSTAVGGSVVGRSAPAWSRPRSRRCPGPAPRARDRRSPRCPFEPDKTATEMSRRTGGWRDTGRQGEVDQLVHRSGIWSTATGYRAALADHEHRSSADTEGEPAGPGGVEASLGQGQPGPEPHALTRPSRPCTRRRSAGRSWCRDAGPASSAIRGRQRCARTSSTMACRSVVAQLTRVASPARGRAGAG